MAKKENLVLELPVLIALVIIALAIFAQFKNREVNLCQKVFSGLTQGSYGVAKFIDWEGLKALDVDVGSAYTKLPNEKEKLNYKKAFISNFSSGFKGPGGRLKAFANWRIYYKDNERTVVAADYLGKNKTLIFTFLNYGKPKLIAIQWEESR